MAGRRDVVVVSAGHYGLIAACYLARAGRDVLVVEALDRPGAPGDDRPLVGCLVEVAQDRLLLGRGRDRPEIGCWVASRQEQRTQS